jgi:NAD(P)-dependent dehydrogenase (short-subunit alcohol dehydrogenase family)
MGEAFAGRQYLVMGATEEWRRVMRVNLDGSFFAMKHGWPKVAGLGQKARKG